MTTPTGGNIGDATVTVNANTTAALRDLNQFSRDAQGRIRDVRGRFVSEGRLINGTLTTVTRNTSRFSDAVDSLRGASLLLSPALIPIAAQAAPIAAGMGAATVAVGAFAAAAAGQASAISEAAEAEKKYQDAVSQHGRASKQAAEAQAAYARQVQQMPAATRTTAAALSSLKDQYQDWSDALASSTMPVATKAFQTFGAVFPKLTPLVKGTSQQLNRFVTIAAGGISSPGFDRFMNSFSTFAVGALAKANDALIRFTRTLDTGKVSGGVSEFMAYVQQNGPMVRDTITKVAEALSNILVAASNVGPGLLTVVNALAGLVAAVPPGAITALLQLALAVKAVKIAAAGAAVVTGMSASIAAMQTAAAGAAGVVPRLSAAIATLSRTTKLALAGTGIGLLVIALSELSQIGRKAPPDVDKMTTSLGKLAQTGKLTGEAARVFGTDFKDLGEALRTLARPSNAEKVQQTLTSLIGMDSTPVKDAKEAFEGLDEGLTNLVKGGNAEIAAEALKQVTANLEKQGFTADEVRAQVDGYTAGLADLALEQEFAAKAQGLFGEQALATSRKLAEQKQSADGLRQAIQALNDVNRSALGGQIAFEASIDAAAKAAQENAGSLRMVNGVLDTNSPKAQAAATALNDLAVKTDEAAAANRESTNSWAGAARIYERGRQQLIKNAMAMGLTRDEAAQLASQILKTPDKTALLKADISDWKSKISEASEQLKNAKGEKKAKLTADIADWRVKVAQAERQLLGAKATKQAKLTADIEVWKAKVKQAETQLKNAPARKKATLTANIDDLKRKIATARGEIASVRGKQVKISVIQEYIQRGVPGPHASGFQFGRAGGLVANLPRKAFPRYASGGPVQAFPHGGFVEGPGTPTSDSVTTLLPSGNVVRTSDTEYVVRGAAVRHYGVRLFDALNAMRLPVPSLAAGGVAGAGADVGAGLVSGMAGSVGAVLAAARAMAAAVVAGIREELQIASPSKKTKALAKDVGKGFIDGLTGSRAKIQSVAKDLAKDIQTAFSGRRESSLLKMVKQETKELLDLANKRDAISKKIAEANKFASDTASQARATGSLASIVQPDAFSPKFVKQQMQASLNQIKAFTANVQKLQKKGLNKDLLRQILEMGPEQGAAFAASLAGADKATIKQYNSLNAQINKESSKLGKVGADLLFDSGKKAGDGFLTGLKAQQKQIEKLMLDIAKGMQAAIRKALGISSPARKLIPDGINTARGLALGVVRGLPHIDSAMRRVAGSVTAGVPPAASVPNLASMPAGRRTAQGITVNYAVHVTNNGMISSQRELETWFVRTLDNTARTNRIPVSLTQAIRRAS
ncbi:hypothetical protein [Streptomyces regalis]|uniref:Bacteriophage tail tape measure N-terminal domain-containing protein n=1 Tax=Streptomyces regalis TaxID=68262 RepID=A0A101JGW8_9ACTN|nr:hypothetical protein [Streptomyces regalis]KUL26618.1 hypothetical protein ADL12_32180 [Streptomyces regalis]